MKKYLLTVVGLAMLSACSAPPQQTASAPLDTKTVEEYKKNVYSGNTVSAAQKQQAPTTVEMPLNASDNGGKKIARYTQEPRIILAPSVGYGYYRGHRHWHHW
ncbi:membrane lipoprotein lipid attachment site-containing protein [Caviibacterium pharyngocola]|uniref:Lipoprotein n=1 Tax=Caviibacterium pharyngocola TaxID=28159 RepID=A0A2M8RVF8_9PAST|nr:membrane lipoprotein lipid attachment site-containing protein [Caviibacterium pharyngocola]PJG82879.1 hypothetical protein CVP04_05790 [Caviibacterium pharyngocola]